MLSNSSITADSSTLQYAYDGEGNRVKKQVVGGTKDYYVRGVDGQTLAVYDGYGALQFFNILAGSEVIGTWDGTQRRYFLKDHLGSVRTTVDQSGNVDGYDDYYPFGLTMPGRSSNSANPNDQYKFTGHERDDEAGLNIDYMGARMYDPVIARFMSIDPLANMYPSWTPYHYVHNNPLNLVDPNGMMACEDDNKICQWWADFTATVGEVLKNAQVNITFNFGEDGEVTATSEVSQEQTMMANAMLADMKGRGDVIEAGYNAMGYIPGVDVAQDLYEGDYGSAALNASTFLIPAGKLASKGGSVIYRFGGKEFLEHFAKHGDEFAKVFGNSSYGMSNYLDDISNTLTHGTYVPELNGFVKLIGGQGSAKYGFVGLKQGSTQVTTFHIKSAKELSKKAPSLGITY